MNTETLSVVLPVVLNRERSVVGGTSAYVIGLERELLRRDVGVTILGSGPPADGDGSFRSIVPRTNALGRHLSWALWRRRRSWDFHKDTIIHLQRPDHSLGFQHGPWPIVLTYHGRHQLTVSLRGGSLAGSIYKRVEQKACGRADALIFVSQTDRNAVLSQIDVEPSRAHVVPVGIDRQLFQPRDQLAARAELELPPGVSAIGFAGRLAKEKNVRALIQAMERVQDGELWIAGGGPLENEFRREAGPRVRFVGFLGRQQMPLFLSACDALALASHHEGLPTVVLESWACGRPVIAPPVGDLPLILDEGGGVLVGSPDVDALADAIRAMLAGVPENAAERARQESALRDRSLPYDWGHVADRIVSVYREALERRRQAR